MGCIAAHTTNMNTTSALYTTTSGQALPNLQANRLEPGEYTIQFEVSPPPDGKGYYAQAIVNWKVQGQQMRRVISVTPGAAISGVAEAVDVSIVDYSGPISNFLGAGRNPQPYKVFGTLSKGTRPNIQQPAILQNTYPILASAGSTSAVIAIPDDSGVANMIAVIVTTSAGVINPGDIIVRQRGNVGIDPSVFQYCPLSQQAGPNWIPVSPGATGADVINRSAIEVVANILWGVEG